jgi:hypothetical protein
LKTIWEEDTREINPRGRGEGEQKINKAKPM